jgi:hypothetical protein
MNIIGIGRRGGVKVVALVGAMLALCLVSAPAWGGSVRLHRIHAAGRCEAPNEIPIESIDVSPGRLVLSTQIEGYKRSNAAGIPQWRGFRMVSPETGEAGAWVEYAHIAVDDRFLRTTSEGGMTPKGGPAEGGKLELTEVYQVIKPFRLQIRLQAPTIRYGDGSCEQFAMEHTLNVENNSGNDASTSSSRGHATPSTKPKQFLACAVWTIQESNRFGIFKGKWILDPTGRYYRGQWENGALALLEIVSDDGTTVVLRRNDAEGASKGLAGQYVGKRAGAGVKGNMSWSYGGENNSGAWSASCGA